MILRKINKTKMKRPLQNCVQNLNPPTPIVKKMEKKERTPTPRKHETFKKN